jgi:site-specific DNA recombinase
MKRPALQGLLADIRAGWIDILVIYEVDRLTQSLANFARLVEIFDAHDAAFVPVTQQLNTTSEMRHLTLNLPHKFDFIEFIFHPTRRRRPIASLDGSRVE